MRSDKTVAALSSAKGRGAIAIVRVTGDDALKIASAVFKPKAKRPLYSFDANKTVYGVIMQDGDVIDDGIAVIYKAPHSYTGEDMAEIMCHGGVLVTRLVLEALFEAGACPAGAGEFTKRAFVNGKLSLSGAEAVMDVIDAQSRAGLKLASVSGRERLSGEIGLLYDEMKSIVASIYAYIDYPDEDLSDVSPETMLRRVEEIDKRLERLVRSYEVKKAVSVGIDTVICGKPNVGKSSLLNAMSGEEVAIVTSTAGTTRDVVTNTVNCGDAVLRLCDTAGIRGTSDEIEAIGVDRAMKKMRECSLALAVFDATRPFDTEDARLVSALKDADCAKIAVINKCDGEKRLDESEISKHFENVVHISAKTSEGIDELGSLTEKMFLAGGIDYDEPHIANARQLGEISSARQSLKNVCEALKNGQSVDIASIDLTDAMEAIGRADGTQISEDIVGEIFSKFCVGK